jgi:hypothetical protein
MNFQLFEYFEWAALLTGVAFLKQIWKTPFVLLIPYLLLIVIIESGNHFGWFFDQPHRSNNWIYNILLIIEFPVISYLLFANSYNNINIRLFWILQFIYFLFYFINIVFIQGLWFLNTYTILLISFLIISLALNRLYKIVLSEDIYNITSRPYFWFTTGVLLFYVLEVLLYTIFPYLAYNRSQLFLDYFMVITNCGIILLYSSIIICFYLIWRTQRK